MAVEDCQQAEESFRAMVQAVMPDWNKSDNIALKKLAGPFNDNDTPLGHSLRHMAEMWCNSMVMPMLDSPPAAYKFILKVLLDTYRTGISIGRMYELAREGRTLTDEEIKDVLVPHEHGEFDDDDD